ncbi:TMC [Cinara cedri]|uniref:TMC n=1 Tax=Cinara cedri TaxID=506608 RepID=A0A5E4NK39_9HEMI|nr:TMC [Cinara cedri]
MQGDHHAQPSDDRQMRRRSRTVSWDHSVRPDRGVHLQPQDPTSPSLQGSSILELFDNDEDDSAMSNSRKHSVERFNFEVNQAHTDKNDEDYSASVNAVLYRRLSIKKGKHQKQRRSSSPMSSMMTDDVSQLSNRRRSSAFTISSGDTTINIEEDSLSEEQLFENIRLHKEVLGSVCLQPWPMRRKMKLVQQAKEYVKKHEGQLQERLAMKKNTWNLWARFKIFIVKKWQHTKRKTANVISQLIPWEQTIKEIESQFGTMVASYFTFLRWLLWVNLVISMLLAVFVIVPEVLTTSKENTGDRKRLLPDEEPLSMNFLDWWNFEGVLKQSPIFYGFYSNRSNSDSGYQLPTAYFITGLVIYIYSFVAILRKMAANSRLSKLSEKDDECVFTWKLFTGWDYMIGNEETAINRISSIILGFKEALLEETERMKNKLNWKVVLLRIFVNLIVICMLGYSIYAITYMEEISIVKTLIEELFPPVFEKLGILEYYHPRTALRLLLARIMALILFNLYAMTFSLFNDISEYTKMLDKFKPLNSTIFATTPGSIFSTTTTRALITTAALLNSTVTTPMTTPTQIPMAMMISPTTNMTSLPPPINNHRDVQSECLPFEIREVIACSIPKNSQVVEHLTVPNAPIGSVIYSTTVQNGTTSDTKRVQNIPANNSETVQNMNVVHSTSVQNEPVVYSETVLNGLAIGSKTMQNGTTSDLKIVQNGITSNSKTVQNISAGNSETMQNISVSDSETVQNGTTSDSKTVQHITVVDSETMQNGTATYPKEMQNMNVIYSTTEQNGSAVESETVLNGLSINSKTMQNGTTSDLKIVQNGITSESKTVQKISAVDTEIVLNETTSDSKTVQNRTTSDSKTVQHITAVDSETMQIGTATYPKEMQNMNVIYSTTEQNGPATTVPEPTDVSAIGSTVDNFLTVQTTTIRPLTVPTEWAVPTSSSIATTDGYVVFSTSTKADENPTEMTSTDITLMVTEVDVYYDDDIYYNDKEIKKSNSKKSNPIYDKSTSATSETTVVKSTSSPTDETTLDDSFSSLITDIPYQQMNEILRDGRRVKRTLQIVLNDTHCFRIVCLNNVSKKSNSRETTKLEFDAPGEDYSLNVISLPLLNRTELRKLCWETYFGQELVKTTIMELVTTIVRTCFGDFLVALFVRYMNRCWCWDLEKRYPQYEEFRIAENILQLINNQGMVWMGMFFSPGLPIINVLNLMIMMYVRSWTILTCNVPHEIVFRASRSNNFYLCLLLIMLFLCVLPVGYAIVWIEPSWHCGPFSQYNKIYHIFTHSIKEAVPSPVVHSVFGYIASPSFIIPLLLLLILVIYYLTSFTSSLREANTDLKIQLRQERTEERRKMFLLVNNKNRGDGGNEDEEDYTCLDTTLSKWKQIMPDNKFSMDGSNCVDGLAKKKQTENEVLDKVGKKPVHNKTNNL